MNGRRPCIDAVHQQLNQSFTDRACLAVNDVVNNLGGKFEGKLHQRFSVVEVSPIFRTGYGNKREN
ncbi:hypothetical protein D3C80_496030 [compost metagenome]